MIAIVRFARFAFTRVLLPYLAFLPYVVSLASCSYDLDSLRDNAREDAGTRTDAMISGTPAATEPDDHTAATGRDAATACVPDETTETSCDGRDNDCDGQIDEAFPTLGQECAVSTGACIAHGTFQCSDDAVDCSAQALSPSAETCNGIDDDCDSVVDNGYECELGSAPVACEACGYSGERKCLDDCSLGACAGFEINLSFHPGPDFAHECGSACGDDWCTNDSEVEPNCLVVSGGPGVTLPRGRYEAVWDGGIDGTHDFAVVSGSTVLSGITDYVMPAEKDFADVVLPFTLSDCTKVDFRMVVKGTHSYIRLYSLDLERVGD